MNDELIQRWRDGDAKANTAVRNAVRSVAERVLGHPSLVQSAGPSAAARLRRDDRRRELTAEVAVEVMKRRVDNSAQLSAMALMVAGRHAVAALQENHPPADDAHLPPQVAVTFALAPNGLMPRVREAAERHVERCSHCAGDLRLLERIVAAQEASDPTGPEHDEVVEEAARVEQLFAEVQADLQGGRRSPAPGPKARPRAKTTARRVLPSGQPDKRRSPWVFAVPFVALLAAGAWLAMRDDTAATAYGTRPEVAALADRSPPAVARVSDLPSEVQFAVADLAQGDCKTAAGRFRAARSRKPEEPRLFVLEAASFVCAGDGARALKVFDELDDLEASGVAAPHASYWFRAQANLLRGDVDQAIEALQAAVLHDPKHRKAADEQLAQLKAQLASG